MACGYPGSPPRKPRRGTAVVEVTAPDSTPPGGSRSRPRRSTPPEPSVLEQVRLRPHPQPAEDGGGGRVARVQPGDDTVQVEVLERDAEQVPGALGGQPAALEVGVQHVADLTAAVLDAAQHQHQLADQPSGGVVERGEGDPVPVDLQPERLVPLPGGPGGVLVTGLPGQVPRHVVPAVQVVELREVLEGVRPQPHPLGGRGVPDEVHQPSRASMGVPTSTVRLTVQSRSWDCCTARGSTSAAARPESSSGNATSNVRVRSVSRLPWPSRILVPVMLASNRVGSARLPVIRSTSIALHPAIAASSSSTGVKASSPPPAPNSSVPPRAFVAWYRPEPSRVTRTLRCLSSLMAAA